MKPAKIEPLFYTRGEVAGLLRISLPTLAKFVREGKIKARHVGERRVLFSRAELERFAGAR